MIVLARPLALFLAEARRRQPNEACGLFGGRPGRIMSFYACANVDQSPFTYRIDPARILSVLRQMEAAGQSLVAIGHSHPTTPAVPSQTDVREAHYPGCLYLIASLRAETPEVRGFWIDQGQVVEEPLEVTGGPSSRAR